MKHWQRWHSVRSHGNNRDNKVLSHMVTIQFPVCSNAAMFQKEQRRLTLKGPLQRNWGADIYFRQNKIFTGSCIIHHASCIMHHASCILYHVSCIMHNALWPSSNTSSATPAGVLYLIWIFFKNSPLLFVEWKLREFNFQDWTDF